MKGTNTLLWPGAKRDTSYEQLPRNKTSVFRPFKAAVERAGIPKKFRLHDLRHTFAGLFLASGGDIFKPSKISAPRASRLRNGSTRTSPGRVRRGLQPRVVRNARQDRRCASDPEGTAFILTEWPPNHDRWIGLDLVSWSNLAPSVSWVLEWAPMHAPSSRPNVAPLLPRRTPRARTTSSRGSTINRDERTRSASAALVRLAGPCEPVNGAAQVAQQHNLVTRSHRSGVRVSSAS